MPGAALARRSRRSACSSHMPPRYRSPSGANTEMKRREKRKLKKIADPILGSKNALIPIKLARFIGTSLSYPAI
uniref:Uncharacterized protein n=1 Tax=Oryza glumipatula TaxID=40148 RepID=A0A0E0BCZ7_9ORYZ